MTFIFIIRLEARLQPNTGFTFERAPYGQFTDFRQPNFTKFEQDVDRCRDEFFRNKVLKIFP